MEGQGGASPSEWKAGAGRGLVAVGARQFFFSGIYPYKGIIN